MTKRLTTDEWIARAKSKHGDLYDYSRVKYTGQTKKVQIGCAIHGWFQQNAGSHANGGSGCPTCYGEARGDKRRLPLSKFLEKARKIHGDKYDYSRVEYVKAKNRVIIGCNNCGKWFEQTPDKHTNAGRGCWDCGAKGAGLKQRLTTSEFVNRAKEIHGEQCDYTNTVYTTRFEEVSIWCNSCEIEFTVGAGHHLAGQVGCSSCRYTRAGDATRKSTKQWIDDAVSVHGSEYDYSEVVYTGNKKKVKIRCLSCDLNFMQEAKAHILGNGCPSCRYLKISEKTRIPVETILERCKEIHGDRWQYNWDGIEYQSTNHKMPIHCPEHGDFLQTMQKHLAGQGCPSCSTVGFDPSKPGYYYVHRILNSDGDIIYFKGGISGNWVRRLGELSEGLPEGLSIENQNVMYFENGHDARELETKMLQFAKQHGFKAPPRDFDGGHELFLSNPIEYVDMLL